MNTTITTDDDLVEVIVAPRQSVGHHVNGVLVTSGPGTTITVTRSEEKYLRETGAIVDPNAEQPPVIVTAMRLENNPASLGLQMTTH